MRSRTAGALTAGGVVMVLTGVGWGVFAITDSGSTSGQGTPANAATRAEGEDRAVIELPDGRKVEMRYVEQKGLGERHYDPGTGKWSATKLIHRTEEDPCQGIELAATDGTVAAIADFGQYCYDGEPPQESIAAVGTGRFTRWGVDRQKGFDGWNKANVAEGGDHAAFLHYTEERIETLRWSEKDGYSGPSEKPRPARRLDERFFGSWKAEDGSQRLAVQQSGNGGVATFFSRSGERCVTRAGLHPNRRNVGEFTAVFRESGERSEKCPMYGEFEFMTINKAGTRLSFQVSKLSFTKTEPDQAERELPDPPEPVTGVDKDWLGSWELEDGSQRVTIREPRPQEPTAVFTNLKGRRCVARAELYTSQLDTLFNVASRPPKVIEGEPAANCPQKNVHFSLSADGKSFTQKAEDGPGLTYVRPSGPGGR
ncbi:hypothetical protein G4Z16_05180 [Streptomyces bathyalis]|uniref:Uncharacterized protein n=1 Tax=Streptomyces bathyalis TaxID=2710756 RepID=A0A7T1WSL6_9ACTN|nr:hypothetical protein [Streptomyces bathyalis]QPP05890.1 hypothetical protein G4Z16_05180 [Streptomyces bathyalis]